MLSSERDRVCLRLVERLLDQLIAGALIKPSLEACSNRSFLPSRSESDRLWAANLSIVLTHGGFMRGELLLNRGALIAHSASEIPLSIGQLIRIEAKLRFGDGEIVRAGAGAARPVFGSGRLREFLDGGLVLFDDLLEVRDFPRERERRASERRGVVGRPHGEPKRKPGRLRGQPNARPHARIRSLPP